MRSRNIKPGFWANDELAELGSYAQLLFAGLWCLADREGKLKDRPKMIKAQIFPYYEPKPSIEILLNQLAEAGFLIRYQADGLKIIKIINFLRHQSPHHTERQSELPDYTPEIHGEPTVNLPLSHGENPPDSLNHESGIMNHESSNPPLPPLKRGETRQFNGRSVKTEFPQFWQAYPRRTQKALAEKAYQKALTKNRLPPLPDLIGIIDKQKDWPQWGKDDGQYIPHPATWLNQERWFDEPPEDPNERKWKEAEAKYNGTQ